MTRRRNGGQKDCAMMWFTSDFRGSLKVQAMTWAEQGMYRHLLDLAWENGGLPADRDELMGILKLGPDEFAAAWKKIGRCFHAHPEDPTRLVNERQERERQIRSEVRQKRAIAGARGNLHRWRAEDAAEGSQEDPNVVAKPSREDRKPIAGATDLRPQLIANASQDGRLSRPRPQPPEVRSGPSDPADPEVRSVPSCSSDARDPQQDDRFAASGPAGPEGPAGHPAGPPPGPEARSQSRAAVWQALRASPYRANAKHRDRELLDAARKLDNAGITPDDLARLALLAKARGDSPSGLFSHWIDHVNEALKELSKRSTGETLARAAT